MLTTNLFPRSGSIAVTAEHHATAQTLAQSTGCSVVLWLTDVRRITFFAGIHPPLVEVFVGRDGWQKVGKDERILEAQP